MNRIKNNKPLFHIVFLQLSTLLMLSGCDSNTDVNAPKVVAANQIELETVSVPEVMPIAEAQPEIENKSYLFVVNDHSIDEFEALLNRAEQVSQSQPKDFEDLEIVMVIHGPDIDFFTNKNQASNSQLLDIAKRLDLINVIDMKVCETTMSMRGVERNDIPSFIESVPFAPTEIKERLEKGYINL